MGVDEGSNRYYKKITGERYNSYIPLHSTYKLIKLLTQMKKDKKENGPTDDNINT